MTATPAAAAAGLGAVGISGTSGIRGIRGIRSMGALLLAALAALTLWQPPWVERLQAAWFDAQQAMWPRAVQELPVTIVEIDQASLMALGQWPWPRNRLAQLVRAVNEAGPAAIGLNVLMSEPDALSPERLLAESPQRDDAVQRALRALDSNDAALARALAAAPAALVLVGTQEPTPDRLRVAPVLVRDTTGGADTAPAVTRYAGALTSIEELERQATGHGLISVDNTRGIVRRLPLVASVQGTLVPALAVEMLRLAARAPALGLTKAGAAVTALSVGGMHVATERDGAVRVHFSPHRADRFVSALDVLRGHVDPARLRERLVLLGPTALGLAPFQVTPIGEAMSGIEIQAQLLENLVGGSLLRRPGWAPAAEAGLLLLLGGALVWVAPRLSPLRVTAWLAGSVLLALGLGWAMFRWRGLWLDGLTPGLYLFFLAGVLMTLSLSQATRQRRALQGVLQAQREQGARMAGEMAAAQRIQQGSLPRPELLRGDPRIDLHACLTAAREVGGDLYDFFMLDERRLFLLVGDVAGKGLSASIFMAVSKALLKGAMLRAPHADLGEVLRAADAEISRDNTEALFVTTFAAVLDLDSGLLSYCNAGHDNPWLLAPGSTAAQRIEDGDGPPLCTAPGFPYRSASCRLQPGTWLCVVTDGVTEAQDPAGALYGAARAERLFIAQAQKAQKAQGAGDAAALVQALQADVAAFAAGAEPADDLTILALRWRGPAA